MADVGLMATYNSRLSVMFMMVIIGNYRFISKLKISIQVFHCRLFEFYQVKVIKEKTVCFSQSPGNVIKFLIYIIALD